GCPTASACTGLHRRSGRSSRPPPRRGTCRAAAAGSGSSAGRGSPSGGTGPGSAEQGKGTDTRSLPHEPRLRAGIRLEELQQLLHDFLLPRRIRVKSILGVIRALPLQAVLAGRRSIRPEVGTPQKDRCDHVPLLRVVVQRGIVLHLFLNRPANGKGALV